MSALAQLRSAGIRVAADGSDLVLRGKLRSDLVELARANKPQVLCDLAEEAAMRALYSCPAYEVLDYEPVGSGRRRCLFCGNVWRRS